jgi:hypothetical protein
LRTNDPNNNSTEMALSKVNLLRITNYGMYFMTYIFAIKNGMHLLVLQF